MKVGKDILTISVDPSITTTELTEPTEKRQDNVTGAIIGAAIEVHNTLGPGLLESAYEGRTGLLINFNVKLLKDGIRRMRI